jgi:SIR2-like domain
MDEVRPLPEPLWSAASPELRGAVLDLVQACDQHIANFENGIRGLENLWNSAPVEFREAVFALLQRHEQRIAKLVDRLLEESSYPPAEVDYGWIVEKMLKGRVIPFLGAGVNLCNRPQIQDDWNPSTGVLPSGWELTRYLASRRRFPKRERVLDLLRVSQYVEVKHTEGTLYDDLHELFNRDFPPTPVHHLLASLPSIRGRKGFGKRYQVILTTNYDDVLERAFEAVNEPFDVVIYEAKAKSEMHGKFWHRSSDGTIDQPIPSPSSYQGLVGDRTVIVKIHGAVERRKGSGIHDSYVISEDHYIDFLVHERVLDRFPIPLRDKLTECSFLFLGYALRDWNLRVLLRRIWKDQPLEQESWAVARNIESIDRLFWSKRNVTIIDSDLADFSAHLNTMLNAAPAVETRP